MAKKERITRYTDKQIADLLRRGKSKTDWKRVAATTYKEIERQVAEDPDEAGMVVDWASASTEMPEPKAVLNMRVDKDVLDYFRKKGPGYQTRINAVLRAYVKAEQRRAH